MIKAQTDQQAAVEEIMIKSGIELFGFAAFDELCSRLIPCSAQKRLPKEAKTVIAAVFPYYSGEREGANLSKYSWPVDYHLVIGETLRRAAQMLREAFAPFEFAAFCDASPINEVLAARLAGLGCVGDNGLLTHPIYGSFVFVGEIVTNLSLEPCREQGGFCLKCGLCRQSCPAKVLGGNESKSEKKIRCLSAVTQKKGILSADEENLIKAGGSVWGCDICQNVCPLNKSASMTQIGAFQSNIKTRLDYFETLSEDFNQNNADRAYIWKGVEVLKRNTCIIEGLPENNINKSHKR